MKKRSGFIWLSTGVIFALIAGALAFVFILRMSKVETAVAQTPDVEVVFATRFLEVRQLIGSSDVEVRTAPADVVPENAIRDPREVVGQLTLVSLSPGEMILRTNVISPTIAGAHVAYTMDEDQVAMAFPAEDLMSSNYLLQAGDHVDVLFSVEVTVQDEDEGELITFNALQNLEVAAVIKPRGLDTNTSVNTGLRDTRPEAIVFALDPQDALVLKHLKDIGGMVDIVLRAPEAEGRFRTQPVHEDYLIDRYELHIPIWSQE
jgi:pilus assembly protein CpaB